jgi:hypothetical protein
MSYRTGPNIELEQGAAGGQPLQRFEETNPFPSKASTIYIIFFSLNNIYFMCMIVHLRTEVG